MGRTTRAMAKVLHADRKAGVQRIGSAVANGTRHTRNGLAALRQSVAADLEAVAAESEARKAAKKAEREMREQAKEAFRNAVVAQAEANQPTT